MIKSVSSWICDESGIQAHITMISKKSEKFSSSSINARIFVSFSTRFMTKRELTSSTNIRNSSSSRIWILLLFSFQSMTKGSEFIALIIKTRYKTFQIRFFKGISHKIVKIVRLSHKIVRIVTLSHRIVKIVRIRRWSFAESEKTFKISFSSRRLWYISSTVFDQRTSKISISNEIKWLLSFLSLWFRRTWLLSLWSEEISLNAYRQNFSICRESRNFTKTQTNSELELRSHLCLTRKATTFDDI
jgi:hypothetical protein